MAPPSEVDVLIVSLGSTEGLRRADDELRDSLGRAGARVVLASPAPPVELPTLMLTDLAWASAARRAAGRALAELAGDAPRAIIYSSTTAALLWPRPGAIRFDAPSAGNRPGRHGLWQRPLEYRRLRRAALLLPWSEGALGELPRSFRGTRDALTVPVPVEPSAPNAEAEVEAPGLGEREIAAITYAANPSKKGLDRVLSAWRQARSELPSLASSELVVAGAEPGELARAGYALGGEPGVRVAGHLPAAEYRRLVRRSRVFLCAPRREDYGIAQLEALADGCQLVTTASPGPYAALSIARALDPRLVGEDLAAGLRSALEDPLADYAARARGALAPFSRRAVDRLVAEELLPRLLG